MTVWTVVVLPLVAGPLLWIGGSVVGRRRSAAAAVGAAGSGVLLATAGLGAAATVTASTARMGWGAGLELTLAAEGVAGVVAVFVAVVAAAVVAYASVHESAVSVPRMVGLLVAFAGAMQLLVLAQDLLTLLLAWELVGAMSWALIGFDWQQRRNVESAGHAFLATRGGELGLFIAAGAIFAATGSLGYADIGSTSRPLLDVAAAGLLVAAAAKSAQLPFSPWLFSAMAGPTPVSALLHSATMVAAGAYALLRLAPSFEAVPWFGPAVMAVGLATAIAGGLMAMLQNHGKRVLAASTSAQYGLMFTAIGAGAGGAAAAHLVAHAVFKALLFLGIGVALHAAGTADITRMRLRRPLPQVAAAFGIGAAALAGIPPLGGAWTKEEIVAAAGSAGSAPLALVLLAGFLSAVYATRLHLLAFGVGDQPRDVRQPARTEVVVLALLAATSIVLGLLWLPAVAHWAEGVIDLPFPETTVVGTLASLAVVAAGVAAGVLLVRSTRAMGLLEHPRAAAAADWFGLPAVVNAVVVVPVLTLARALAVFDARVIDGGVRAVARVASAMSRGAAWWAERGVDGTVEALARGAVGSAAWSARADDVAVDGAVEGVAAGVGRAGARARMLQSGLAHQYYLIIAAGTVALVAAVAIGR